MKTWDRSSAFGFAMNACLFCWALSFAATFGPGFEITIRPLQFTVQTSSILMVASSFLPAFYCFITYPECRSSLWKVNASWKVYASAVVTGVFLPFTSYLGTHNPAFPWGRPVAVRLIELTARYLVLGTIWEEIVWRGCFLTKIRTFMTAPSAILLMSVGWTIWHGGYLAYYYGRSYPIDALIVFVFTVFFTGILFGSLFVLAQGSIWPGVLAHAAFDAGMVVFYGDYNRTSELGSYVAELIFVALVGGILFRAAMRKSRLSASAVNDG